MPPGIPNPKSTPHYYTMPLPHLLLLLLSFVSLPLSLSDLSADRAALLLLRSAVGGRTLLWNTTAPSPCNWAGVHCDNTNNRVTVLRLPGNSLTGKLPPNVFANLTQLRTLSLRLNNLVGPLPDDLSSCTELRNLYLQGNRFSGELPEFLFGLKDLVRLNLAGNNFSGEIPAGFNNLTRLGTLFLENNRFTGSVPDLGGLKGSLVQFNVSNNLLSGPVPKSLQGMGVSSFAGNSLCGPPFKESCGGSSSSSSTSSGGNGEKGEEEDDDGGLSGGAIAGIVIGSVVGLLVLVCVVCVLCRRRKKGRKASAVDVAAIKHYQQDVEEGEKMGENGGGGGGGSNGFSVAAAAAAMKGESGGGNVGKKLVFFGNSGGGGRGERVFDLEDLLRASAEVLGKGTFGTAYKAVLEAGTVVAVKRLKDVTISEREFREKIELVGAMDHQNLVPLRAYYYSREEKLLVYDYMTMGSLSALLHGNKGAGRTPLNWEFRSSIALGAARGIEYLHSQGSNISHGNIKSSNILLTKSIEARVSDFGLAHLVGPSSTPNRVAGYRAPEVTDPRKVSQKADVYSFGVLLLELLTGKAPTHALLNEEGVDLPRWVQSVVKEEWSSEVFDLELLRYQNVENEMVQLLQLAMDCTEQYPDKRPSMSEVTKRIEGLCGSSAKDDHIPHPDLVDEEN